MAETDWSIYHLLGRGVSPETAISGYEQGTQFALTRQAAQQRSAMGQLALEEAQRQRQVEEQTRAAYRRAYRQGGPTPASTVGQLAPGPVQETARGGQPTAAFPSGGGGAGETFPPLAEQEAASTQKALYGTLPAGYSPNGPAPVTSPQTLQRTPGQPPIARGVLAGAQAGVDTAGLVRDLYQIDPQAGMAAEKAARDSHTAQLEMLGKQNAMVSQVARAILLQDTQQAYEVGVNYLRQAGIPVDHLPPIYDRRMVEHYYAMSTDAETRLTEQKNVLAGQQETRLGQQLQLDIQKEQRQGRQFETTQDLSERQLQETQRHHRATEEQALGTAARTQTKEQAERENQLRDEFNALTTDYRTQRDAYGRVQVSAQEPSAAGDLSMIFSYMKLLDPGSVVREGEQATAANARGVPDAIRAWYNRVMAGERLTETQRKDFVDRAQKLYDQSTKDYANTRTQYQDLARRNNVDPANVTLEYGSTARSPGAQGGRQRVSRATVDQLAAEKGAPPRATIVQNLRNAGLDVEE